MIKLEQLQQFLVVSQCNSLMDAAKQLHRTPSAVSMTLKHIEQELGGPLFEGDRKQQLTPLGLFVHKHAQASVAAHRRALDDIGRYARGETGVVRIAAVPSAATQQLPEAIAHCHAERPQLSIELHDTDSAAVHAAVSTGAADLGVASLSKGDKTLHRQLLQVDPFVCVCAANHPLAKSKEPLRWSELQVHAFIHNGLCEQIDHPTVQQLSQNSQLQVFNTASLFAFVRRGLGITLLPAKSVTETQGLATLALQDKKAERSLYLLQRQEESPAPAVRQLAKEIISQYQKGI